MYVTLVTINKSLRCTAAINSCVLILCNHTLTQITFDMVTLCLDTKFLLYGERYYVIFDGKIVKIRDLWCSQCYSWSLRLTPWSSDTAVFQWMFHIFCHFVLNFDYDSGEISLLSSTLVTFATF